MKKSKLESFMHSESALEVRQSLYTRGGVEEQTMQQCVEATGTESARDAYVERWPDNGGPVQTFTFQHIPYMP